MGRILFFVIIALLVYLVLRGLFRSAAKRDRADAKDDAPAATTAKGEDMIQCARCGVNLPRSEARDEQGLLVCQNNPHCH